MKRVAIVVGQILLLALIGVLGGYLKEWLNLPLPGTLVGMILLFLLLCSGIIKLNWVEQGAAVLIGELLLFFIPSAIGVIVTSIVTLLISVTVITLSVMKLRRKGYKLW